jgi:tRNA(Ile)-lysidine synthase
MLAAAFSDYVVSHKLFAPGDQLLLALSGGTDSCVLAHLLHSGGYTFAVAHVNHGLRGEASDADAQFCRTLAEQYKVPYFETRFSDLKETIPADESLQSHARNRRYAFLQETAAANGYTLILTAHHFDDRLETFFMHALRGSGVNGLRSILPVNGNVVRPLLFATRAQVEQYAAANNIAFREDESNAEDDYTRNKIRHHLVPALQQISNSYVNGFSAVFENLRDTELLLEQLVPGPESVNGEYVITPGEWIAQPGAVTRMHYLLRRFGFDTALCRKLVAEWNTITSGARFFSATYELTHNREQLLIRPLKQNGFREAVFFSPEDPAPGIEIKLHNVPFTLPGKVAPVTAFFDAGKLVFPLQFRAPQTGDRMMPLGMTNYKKLSDIFIDKKCSAFEKERAQVLVSGDEIIWIPGICYGQAARITAETGSVIEITLTGSTNG